MLLWHQALKKLQNWFLENMPNICRGTNKIQYLKDARKAAVLIPIGINFKFIHNIVIVK